METDRVKTFYTKRAGFYNWLFIDFFGWGRELEAFFRKSNFLSPGLKILDAGCGTGVITRTLYPLTEAQGGWGIQFHAFDLTPAMLDIFRIWITEQRSQNIEIIPANVMQLETQLPPDWRDYDLIISATMLEYIPKQVVREAIRNLKHLLKNKGTLLIFITKRNFLTKWLAQGWWKTNLYEESEIEEILRRVGFSTIRFIPFSPLWQNSILVVEAGN